MGNVWWGANVVRDPIAEFDCYWHDVDMKLLVLVGLAQCLIACSQPETAPEVAKCEDQILAKLEKPDTYKVKQRDSLSLGDHWQVGIEFSYENGAGKRIERAWQTCDFKIVDGKPDTAALLNTESSLDAPPDNSSE